MATQLKSLPSSGVNPEERSSIELVMKLTLGSRSGRDFQARHRGLWCMNLKAQETWDTYYRNDPGKYGLEASEFSSHLFFL